MNPNESHNTSCSRDNKNHSGKGDDDSKNVGSDRSFRTIEKLLELSKKAEGNFAQSKEDVSILFADMVGSTAFKYRHPDSILSLGKTYDHNSCVEKVVESDEFKGYLVKFLGDGVLAFFDGEKAAQRAIQAGLEIIRRLHQKNQRIQDWQFRINTKIGVHHGPVWMMKFEQSNRLDPQGATVDMAARLLEVAPQMHVVVNQETLSTAGKDNFPNRSEPQDFPLHGVPKVQKLFALTCNDIQLQRIPLPGGPTPLFDHIQKALESAERTWLDHHDFGGAIAEYKTILVGEPRSFIANYRLADLLVRHQPAGTRPTYEQLDEAFNLLREAKVVRPYSVYLWTLLSWVQFERYRLEKLGQVPEGKEINPEKRLNGAIRDAEHALLIAKSLMDEYGAAVARIHLIVFHNERIRAGYGERLENLQKAKRYYSEVDMALGKGLDNWLESQLKVGQAMIAIANEDKDREEILGLLAEAMSLHKGNHLAVELLYEVVKP